MTRTETPGGPWEPATPREVAERFSVLRPGAPWWIAGGYAIELAVGYAFRDHGDLDVLLLRRDQLAVQEALDGWQWWAADPPGTLRPWRSGEVLGPDVHDIWCRPGPDEPWRIQVMLDASSGQDWVSRRDSRVRRPIDALGAMSQASPAHPAPVPYLAPEVQLYYKARNPRPKDERDFTAVLPVLTAEQRHWLLDALALTQEHHPWADRLRTP